MSTILKRMRYAAPALLLLIAVPPVSAQAVKVSVVAILASEDSDKIDKRLVCVAREVQKMDPKLTGFRFATMTCKSVPVGKTDLFDLVADQSVQVTVERGSDKEGRVLLKVTPPFLEEIRYETVCGKFLPIITRYRTAKKNELLILAIRVEPCKGR